MSLFCVGKNRFGWTCERKPSVVSEGRHYCWQHDPERLRRVAKEKWEARKKEMAEDDRKHEARIARRQLEEAAGVKDLSDDDLRQLALLGGIKQILLTSSFP